MRSAIGFFSLLAFGFLAAGVLTVIGSGPGFRSVLDTVLGSGEGGVHLGSLFAGMVLGVVLSALARISWAELPRRFVRWLFSHVRGFYRLLFLAAVIAFFVFY